MSVPGVEARMAVPGTVTEYFEIDYPGGPP